MAKFLSDIAKYIQNIIIIHKGLNFTVCEKGSGILETSLFSVSLYHTYTKASESLGDCGMWHMYNDVHMDTADHNTHTFVNYVAVAD